MASTTSSRGMCPGYPYCALIRWLLTGAVFSMVAFHPFMTARESVLAMWSPTAQARRQAPDARLSELFVLLHGMLFTNIQLDDFKPALARFMERLRLEGAEEREWIMMAVTAGERHAYELAIPVLHARKASRIQTQALERVQLRFPKLKLRVNHLLEMSTRQTSKQRMATMPNSAHEL